jgi:hypothetical protein
MRHPVRDSRGVEIIQGAKVAFNRSGDVVMGTVLRVTPSATFIEPHSEFRHAWSKGPSRVRNPRGILVLP